VAETEAEAVTWLPGASIFLTRLGTEVQAYTAEGQPAEVPEGMTGFWEVATAAREGGVDWAWAAPDFGGLQASLGGEPARTITDEAAYRPTWSPNGHTLLFYGEDVLYAAELPGLAPVAVTEPGQLGDRREHTWVP
jgi:hypothetical protein